jgi:endo-1,4-beta-xylanase
MLAAFVAASFTAEGQTLLLSTDPSTYNFSGTGLATGSLVTVTPPSGATFTQAWDINVTAHTAAHDVAISATTLTNPAQGDACVATFWWRRMDGIANESNLVAGFDQMATPFGRSVAVSMRGRNQWRQAHVPFVALGAQSHLFVECGGTIQDVQIAGLQVTDYGQKSVLSTTTGLLDGTSLFTLTNQNGTWGTMSPISVTGNPFFATADQVKTTTSPVPVTDRTAANTGEFRLNANLAKAITAGDTLVAVFWMARDRTSNQGNMGLSGYELQQVSTPNTVISTFDPLMVDGNWKQFCIPFTSAASYPAGGAQFQLWFGATVQTVDVGGIQILDLGPVPLSSLTNNQLDYPGRNITDAWQATAQANIKLYRMGNLTVNVQDGSGAAIANAVVTAAMQKHKFGFGTAANPSRYTGTATIPNYIAALNQYSGQAIFNKVNMANYKWPNWETAGYSAGLNTENQWLRSHGITQLRGHNLVWPNYRPGHAPYIDVPNDVPTLSGTALANRVLAHLDSEVGDPTVHGFIDDWDVVNEPSDSPSIEDAILGGPDTTTGDASVITTWLAEVVKNDPAPYLFINESGLENNTRHTYLTLENYDFNLLSALIADHANIDGFNQEGHFNAVPVPPVTEKAIMDRFAALTTINGPLQSEVTEYDNQFTDPVLRADFLADYMTLAFSEPTFRSFTLWGFWQTDGFGEEEIYDVNWNLLPAGEAWKGLIYNQWWTNTSATSNASGVAVINGFLGRYALTASSGGVSKTYYADLPTTAGATVNLKLDGSAGSTHVWTYEAENAEVIYTPLAVGSDPNASNGGYLGAPIGSMGSSSPPTTPQARINIEATGNVSIWLRVIAPSPSEDSFFAQIDGNPWAVLSTVDGTTWHWFKWTTTTLAAGQAHFLNLGVREPGAEIDQVLVTDDPNFTP